VLIATAIVAVVVLLSLAPAILPYVTNKRAVVVIRNDSGEPLHDVRIEVFRYAEIFASEVIVETRDTLRPGETVRIERVVQYELVLRRIVFRRKGAIEDTGIRVVYATRLSGESKVVMIDPTGQIVVTDEAAQTD
jgi:hypothetical protein